MLRSIVFACAVVGCSFLGQSASAGGFHHWGWGHRHVPVSYGTYPYAGWGGQRVLYPSDRVIADRSLGSLLDAYLAYTTSPSIIRLRFEDVIGTSSTTSTSSPSTNVDSGSGSVIRPGARSADGTERASSCDATGISAVAEEMKLLRESHGQLVSLLRDQLSKAQAERDRAELQAFVRQAIEEAIGARTAVPATAASPAAAATSGIAPTTLEDIHRELKRLSEENERLRAENARLQARIAELEG